MKKEDIIKPWGNRNSSNRVDITEIIKAKIIEPPKKLKSWDTKPSMVIEILEGKASSVREGRSNGSYDGNAYDMSSNWQKRIHNEGSKLIVFSDSFYVVSEEESIQVSSSDTSSLQKVEISDNLKKINQNTLMCLLK